MRNASPHKCQVSALLYFYWQYIFPWIPSYSILSILTEALFIIFNVHVFFESRRRMGREFKEGWTVECSSLPSERLPSATLIRVEKSWNFRFVNAFIATFSNRNWKLNMAYLFHSITFATPKRYLFLFSWKSNARGCEKQTSIGSSKDQPVPYF